MKLTVTWFDNLKGFGEGVTEAGDKVFLHYTAIDSPGKFTLTPGEEIACRVDREYGRLVATHITRNGQ